MKNLKFIDEIIKDTNDVLKQYKDTEKQVIKNLIWNYYEFIKENIKCKNCVLFKKRTFSDYQLSKDNTKKYSEETKKERKNQFEKLIDSAKNKLINLKSNLWNVRARENNETDVIKVLNTLENFYQEFSEKLKPNIDGTLYENTININKKIRFLLEKKISPKTISSLNEESINLIYEKFKKKETKEQVTPMPAKPSYKVGQSGGVLPPAEKGYAIKKNPDNTIIATPMESEMTEDDTLDVVNDPDATADGMGMFETELTEKFESKAQQGLFWAKCNKCKTDDCKWCKMAKEFSKSTSKKQYEKMPEKKHPEKTVKYKKKNTNEEFGFGNYLEKLGAAVTSKMGQETKGITPVWKESIFKKKLENIIEQNLNPTMKKRDLLRLIESEKRRRNYLSEDFYFPTNEAEADFGTITRYDTETKTSERGEEKKAYVYAYVAKDCSDDKIIYIKTKDELYLESFYKIDYDGLTRCVQILFESEKGGKKSEIIKEISSCSDCDEEGGGSSFGMSRGATQTSSETGYQELGGGERKRRTIKRHNPYERPELDPQGDIQESLMIKRLLKNLKSR